MTSVKVLLALIVFAAALVKADVAEELLLGPVPLPVPIKGCQINCKTIKAANPNAASGYYIKRSIIDGFPQNVEMYCEMGLNGGGYTFLQPQALSLMTDAEVQAMFTQKDSFLIRFRKLDGSQPYAVLSQKTQYASIPLKLGLSQYTSYAKPFNLPTLKPPYLYYGFLPIANASNYLAQGIKVNGVDLTFANCDANPQSQITIFPNFQELAPTSYLNPSSWAFCNQMVLSALDNPSGRVINPDYYMFGEFSFGGCACYTQTDRLKNSLNLLGIAIGFR